MKKCSTGRVGYLSKKEADQALALGLEYYKENISKDTEPVRMKTALCKKCNQWHLQSDISFWKFWQV